ncbi:MAG: hypothetical protein A3C55_01255 [Gammaproteobacteria bacterium RIFCSPHIGHO2_02_FULL_42_13]|nr:MAG: hypothetical protein A3C55_01255 [Gammaproteobacteria bacterium RIFCSPHIGHO2_02_FULL_42_13]OGT68770.1 MAG: hypothetical protein A3H43_03910 [Gammaproteobacteria bacterium RIFCSPLOWO2_02_FULL_42_9]
MKTFYLLIHPDGRYDIHSRRPLHRNIPDKSKLFEVPVSASLQEIISLIHAENTCFSVKDCIEDIFCNAALLQ